jgi:hypothetical protein
LFEAIRGDSVWLNIDRIVASILDTRNPPSVAPVLVQPDHRG